MRCILITELATSAMVAAAHAADPMETGGILLGVRAGGRPWVTAIAEIPSAVPGSSSYVLPQGATGRAVDDARRRDERLGYLGEWHTHPSGGAASSQDRRMMRTLGWYLPWPQPVMVIVRRQSLSYELDGYVSRVLILRSAEILLTGSLP